MPYHLHEVHLRVVHKYLRQTRNAGIANARFLIIEHLLPTTAEFVRLVRQAGGDIVVTVYDKREFLMLRAYTDGFHTRPLRDLLETADIIFAATADQALSLARIEECKTDVVLVSAGSKDTEFDVASLRAHAVSCEPIGEYLERFHLSNSKRIVVANRGTAVNFTLPSLPEEILDLVFAEILEATARLLDQFGVDVLDDTTYPPGFLHQSNEATLNAISEDWLRSINPT